MLRRRSKMTIFGSSSNQNCQLLFRLYAIFERKYKLIGKRSKGSLNKFSERNNCIDRCRSPIEIQVQCNSCKGFTVFKYQKTKTTILWLGSIDFFRAQTTYFESLWKIDPFLRPSICSILICLSIEFILFLILSDRSKYYSSTKWPYKIVDPSALLLFWAAHTAFFISMIWFLLSNIGK